MITSKEEMARLLQSSGNLYADETFITGTSLNDIDDQLFEKFINVKHKKPLSDLGISKATLLDNMGMLKNGNLTLGCLLLFGKNPQQFKPTLTVHCIAFKGKEIPTATYRSKKDPFTGNLKSLYEQSLAFIIQNLNEVQVEKGFNSRPKLEIPIETIDELLVNALVHRDYFTLSSIKVFVLTIV